MPQAIAHPVWTMIWTTALKTGSFRGQTSRAWVPRRCEKFLEPKQGVELGPRKMGPGWDPWNPGGSLRVLFFIEIAGPDLRFPGKMHVRVPAGPRSCGFYTTPLGYTMLIGEVCNAWVDQAEWKLFH